MNHCLYKIFECNSLNKKDLTSLEERLLRLQVEAASLIPDKYIWHKQPFTLELGEGGLITGQTEFGDCIEDEWFIVWLLRQLTLADHNIVVSISDNDGEFLLIEAANYLEASIEPELMENRVFLFQGHLHLIPLSLDVESVEAALKLISNPLIETKASLVIEEVAFQRCSIHPQKTEEQIHKSKIYIPHLAAHILYHCPALIAPVIDAFYTRDTKSTELIMERMEKFRPSTNIPMVASFTKILYAQVKSARCNPSKLFSLPPVKDIDFEDYYVGMKVAIGFEILYNNLADGMVADGTGRQSGFKKFLASLEQMNFFEKELVGSNKYKALMKRAEKVYALRAMANEKSPFLHQEFLTLASTSTSELIDPKLLIAESPDLDDWITMEVSEVDEILSKIPQVDLSDEDDTASELDEEEEQELGNFTKIVTGFDNFIGKESGITGALFPGEKDDDSESNSDDESDTDFVEPISFNANVYMEKLGGVANTPPDVLTVTDDSQEEIEAMMDQMDSELASTHIGSDFDRGNPDLTSANLLNNVFASVEAQEGLSGPASNLFGRLGVDPRRR